MDFETVWSRIVEHEGETFYTVRDKKPFTYEVSDNYIIVSRAKNTRNTKNNIKKAFENIDVLTKTEFTKTIIGSAYVRVLLEEFMNN